MPGRELARLERIKAEYGGSLAHEKMVLLDRLALARLRSARQVERLHEALAFLRAYPDDRRVLARVAGMLDRFDRRPDLRRHREALADSGIAGTAIRYRFFWSTALWLATRWPDLLTLGRDDGEAAANLDKALPLIAPACAAEWFNAGTLPALPAMDRLRGRKTDAAWLAGRIAAMPGDGFTREAFADAIDAPFVLEPGPDTPSRSRAHLSFAPRAFQSRPLERSRPDLRAAAATPPRAVRLLPPREGQEVIELARGAMVTRQRDLMAFEYADRRDVRLVDDGTGLAFALCGVVPERRYLLPAIYGGLTLRNGVPLGYSQIEILGRHASLSFNTFATFRGAEAARIFGRLVAATHHVFGATSLSVEPYQLGDGNDEGIESGAWWFYYKLGFRPRAAEALRDARSELARMRARPAHRSPPRVLRALARHHVFLDLEPGRRSRLPDTQSALARGVAALARHGGGEAAVDALERRALELAGLASLAGFSREERRMWRRWAPLVASLPGMSRWSPSERRGVANVVRAKAARRETDFLTRLRAHPRLLRAVAGEDAVPW
jgi:hypothetical protein